MLLLAGCAGTSSNPTGTTHATLSIDPSTGVQTIEVHDGKDRSGLQAQLVQETPGGGKVTFNLTETDINGSAAQAAAMATLVAGIPVWRWRTNQVTWAGASRRNGLRARREKS